MISISELLEPNWIKLELEARKKKQAVRELAGILSEAGIGPAASLASQVLKREKLSSTGIGHGVAIPHTLSEEVDRTVMAFGRSSNGIAFEAADNKPVHLFFFIVGPASSGAFHLKVLSKLSRMVTESSFRDKLMQASTADEIIEILREGDEA